jgi:hypothetical protein
MVVAERSASRYTIVRRSTMGKVILDAATRARLNGMNEQFELYDDQGKLLGYFIPADSGLDALPAHAGASAFSDAEIEEAMKDTDPGRPLADILADLRRK